MSEVRFACPVCGQHLTADSRASDSQVDCPTCFRTLIVPPPSVSTDSKWIVTTSEATKTRPTRVKPVARSPRPTLPLRIVMAIGLAILLLMVAAYFIF